MNAGQVLDELFSGDDERAEAALPGVQAAHLQALIDALTQTDVDRCWWAVLGLARLPGAAATQALLGALEHTDPAVRGAAAHALGQRAAPEAAPRLLETLGDASEFQARLATDALIGIGAPAVPGLQRVLEASPSPRARANAARALALIGDTSAIPALFKALADESALAQYWAEEGLERMGVGQVYFKP